MTQKISERDTSPFVVSHADPDIFIACIVFRLWKEAIPNHLFVIKTEGLLIFNCFLGVIILA